MPTSKISPFRAGKGEFSLIQQYFNQLQSHHDSTSVLLGIGDDCALLQSPTDEVVAISTDTLVEGRHFLTETDPADLAYKAFMVTVSDLAAMGAKPKWLSLALTLPQLNDIWLEKFSEQLGKLLNKYQMELIGGDTTKGPLTLTCFVQGVVPLHSALKRSNAKVGDLIFVSGTLGNSAAGLQLLQHNWQLNHDNNYNNNAKTKLVNDYLYPHAQIELGLALRGIAHAAIDISDGLASDLAHICVSSKLSADIHLNQLPYSDELKDIWCQTHQDNDQAGLFKHILTGGDDYQLCFTVPIDNVMLVSEKAAKLGINITQIGKMVTPSINHSNAKTEQFDVNYFLDDNAIELNLKGFDHFS